MTKYNKILILGAVALVGATASLLFSLPQKSPPEIQIITITIPEGLRKEQTASILAEKLGWTQEQERKFVVKDTARDFRHVDGVYPGGTYQIPSNTSTYEVASMFLNIAKDRYREFGTNLTPDEWYEVLKVAAIVERESETVGDMKILAQGIWQKRRAKTLLQSDATVQYVRDTMNNYASDPCLNEVGDPIVEGMVEYTYPTEGERPERNGCIHWRLVYNGSYENGYDWWVPVIEEDRQLQHGYNTYFYVGLPKHPIATPSREAIIATLETR